MLPHPEQDSARRLVEAELFYRASHVTEVWVFPCPVYRPQVKFFGRVLGRERHSATQIVNRLRGPSKSCFLSMPSLSLSLAFLLYAMRRPWHRLAEARRLRAVVHALLPQREPSHKLRIRPTQKPYANESRSV